MIVVVMGVSGAGKTTLGCLLAEDLGWSFHDADDLHSPSNIEKMRRGEPLTEDDRAPWIRAVADCMRSADQRGENAVFACSALRSAHRRLLAASAADVRFVFLSAPPEIIAHRLNRRPGHFMHPDLLPKQMETLEPPSEAVWVDAAPEPPDVVADIRQRLGL